MKPLLLSADVRRLTLAGLLSKSAFRKIRQIFSASVLHCCLWVLVYGSSFDSDWCNWSFDRYSALLYTLKR